MGIKLHTSVEGMSSGRRTLAKPNDNAFCGKALYWIQAEELKILQSRRTPFANWRKKIEEMRPLFEGVTQQEKARRDLKYLSVKGNIMDYIDEFLKIRFHIPNMTEEEEYNTFILGLRPHERNQITPFMQGLLNKALEMAQRLQKTQAPQNQERFSRIRRRLENPRQGITNVKPDNTQEKKTKTRRCFYCKKIGHLAAN